MTGICAYGGYVPRFRLQRGLIYAAMGWMDPSTIANAAGEKAVANFDEDSITMAVAASLAGLNKIDSKSLDAVFFATTTSPYAEKQGATNIAAAVDAKRNIRTCDFSGSLRANSSAMLAALDGAELGHTTLVAIGDCRLGGADGANEAAFGDGAAAFVFGSENVIARLISLEHPPHTFNKFRRIALVALCIQISQKQSLLCAIHDFCNCNRYLPRNEGPSPSF